MMAGEEKSGLIGRNQARIQVKPVETVRIERRIRQTSTCVFLLKCWIWFSFRLLFVIVWPFTKLVSIIRRRRALPPITNKILLNSARTLAHKIRLREISSQKVVEAFIIRIQEVNPYLNAVVDQRFAQALEEARQVDLMLESTKKSIEELAKETPLLGVPLTVKESVALKGCSNNAGRIVPKERIALEDAEAVKQLRLAGAIPVCVTNTPELCMNLETYNKATGTTNNPYDTRRTTGGSSGGEGALLSSGASVIGVGSDIAGSCRVPAMFTGVFGHKPSPGYVSNIGHMPSSTDKMWDNYFTIGLMTRYAEDLPLMLHLMISDREKAKSLNLLQPVSLSNIRVFYMEDNGGTILSDDVDKEIKESIVKAVQYLENSLGLKAKKVAIDLEDVLELASLALLFMNNVQCCYTDDDHPEKWRSVTKEVLKWMCFSSDYSLTNVFYGPAKKISNLFSKSTVESAEARKKELIEIFRDLLGDNGVFLFPTFTNSAHFHYQIHYKFLNHSYTSMFNLLEMPVTNVPVGLGKNSVPIGFQVATSPGQDRLSMAIAKELESAFGGWVPPSPVL